MIARDPAPVVVRETNTARRSRRRRAPRAARRGTRPRRREFVSHRAAGTAQRPALSRRPPPNAGHTFAPRSERPRVSGRTRASATVVMKLVSPFQRGRTCTWKWPGTPAPAARPRLAPDVEPVGPVRRLEGLDGRGHALPTRPRTPRRVEGLELAHVPGRHHHQVAARVGVGVEDGDDRARSDGATRCGSRRRAGRCRGWRRTTQPPSGAWPAAPARRTRCASRPTAARAAIRRAG